MIRDLTQLVGVLGRCRLKLSRTRHDTCAAYLATPVDSIPTPLSAVSIALRTEALTTPGFFWTPWPALAWDIADWPYLT